MLTHGNGPQVGNELLRQELARARGAAASPLRRSRADAGRDRCARRRRAAPVVGRAGRRARHARRASTRTIPRSRTRRSRSGPSTTRRGRSELEAERGWVVHEDAGRGWRRVVALARAARDHRAGSIRTLLAGGVAVVAVGGGGDPGRGARRPPRRHRRGDRQGPGLGAARRSGSAPKPRHPHPGARASTPASERRRSARSRSCARTATRRILAELPAGSMRPKVEAAFAFVRATGGEALITERETPSRTERARDEDRRRLAHAPPRRMHRDPGPSQGP